MEFWTHFESIFHNLFIHIFLFHIHFVFLIKVEIIHNRLLIRYDQIPKGVSRKKARNYKVSDFSCKYATFVSTFEELRIVGHYFNTILHLSCFQLCITVLLQVHSTFLKIVSLYSKLESHDFVKTRAFVFSDLLI